MSHRRIDVVTHLMHIRNLCERRYNVPATLEKTYRNVPYVKVSTGTVRVVFFAKTRIYRVFYNHPDVPQQMHADFDYYPVSSSEDAVAKFCAITINQLES